MPQAHAFDGGLGKIESGGRIEVERAGFRVQKPFARRVEFLEDVFHEAVFLVHAHTAVVLPAAFVGQPSVRVLAGDEIVKIAPHVLVHRVNEAAARDRPSARRAPG